MRILHSSDWHIGRKLKEHDRAEEFRKFFAWLANVIARENIDALIVPGDIFDTRSPSAEAQEIYYSFLAEISGKSCRHIVITSGNHDSAALIDAPAKIMSRLKIHVVGSSHKNEIITLKDESGSPEMIVCAVPFLRDKDLRTVKAEDTFADVEHQIKTGIKNHYAEIFSRAIETRGDNDIPIVATGHLFLEAGTTRADEGEHSLYVGTAIKVGTDIFPDYIAYVALGHLHSPQKIGRPNIRYSGSPVYMSFGELGVTKTVSIVDFDGKNFAGVREIDIPVFQEMARVSGDMAGIESGIRELVSKNESVWLEVVYTGDVRPADIQKELSDLVKDSAVEILSIIDKMNYKTGPDGANDFDGKTLGDIDPLRMFERLMTSKDVPQDRQDRMKELYAEILQEAKAEEN